ncbi:MAG: polyprenyl synthetase family protein [Nanoarchaeota archaeon]
MEKENYFQRMEETYNIVRPIVEESLNSFKEYSTELYNILSMVTLGRKNNVRTYFLRSAYEAISDKDWKWIAPIGAAIEFHLASTYYTNLVFDEKGGKRTRQEDKPLIIASCITRSLANKCLYSLKDKISLDKLLDISYLFSNVDTDFYSGQYLDIITNIFDNFAFNIPREDSFELYKKRTKGINAFFYEKIGRIASKLAGANADQENALAEFGKNFGIAQQIMDDVDDFVPERDGQSTVTKIPADAHSDFKHGKLTLPIINCLYHAKKEDREEVVDFLKRRNELKENEFVELTGILLKTGSIDYAKREAKEHAKKAKNALKIFSKDKRKWLSDMCVVFDSNRYYRTLENYRR